MEFAVYPMVEWVKETGYIYRVRFYLATKKNKSYVICWGMDETGDSERQVLHLFSRVQKYTHDMKVEDEGDQWELGRQGQERIMDMNVSKMPDRHIKCHILYNE